eukprot:COSAG04_NODE_4920_length_1825_cov_4.126883_3_plen_175_part_00
MSLSQREDLDLGLTAVHPPVRIVQVLCQLPCVELLPTPVLQQPRRLLVLRKQTSSVRLRAGRDPGARAGPRFGSVPLRRRIRKPGLEANPFGIQGRCSRQARVAECRMVIVGGDPYGLVEVVPRARLLPRLLLLRLAALAALAAPTAPAALAAPTPVRIRRRLLLPLPLLPPLR